jgi:hypothetical protein
MSAAAYTLVYGPPDARVARISKACPETNVSKAFKTVFIVEPQPEDVVKSERHVGAA